MTGDLAPRLAQALCRRLQAMADDELILAHRNSEWTGHAPILEEDIAFSNIAQDEMGHAAIWYDLLSGLTGDSPDRLIFLRDPAGYRNIQMVELPRGDWAFTMMRQYLFDAYEMVALEAMNGSRYGPLAGASGKIRPEEIYHYRHTSYWIRRLGSGTEESHRRTQKALDLLWPYAGQFFSRDPEDEALVKSGIIPDGGLLRSRWSDFVIPFLEGSDLAIPEEGDESLPTRAMHTPHLEALLAEMQEVARLEPEAEW